MLNLLSVFLLVIFVSCGDLDASKNATNTAKTKACEKKAVVKKQLLLKKECSSKETSCNEKAKKCSTNKEDFVVLLRKVLAGIKNI